MPDLLDRVPSAAVENGRKFPTIALDLQVEEIAIVPVAHAASPSFTIPASALTSAPSVSAHCASAISTEAELIASNARRISAGAYALATALAYPASAIADSAMRSAPSTGFRKALA